MKLATRLYVLGVLCCAGLWSVSTAAGAADSSRGEASTSVFASPLLSPGSSFEGALLRMDDRARLASPQAVSARNASRMKYTGLSSRQAAAVASHAFRGLLDEPAGGPPKLPAGERITGFPSDRVASTDLGGGRRGVIESVLPMALATPSGRRVPLDLSLKSVGSALEPRTPLVGVRIPRKLSEGVLAQRSGLSLTPVDSHGASLRGAEGVVDGAAAFFGDTQLDTDTVVKPTTAGFALDTVLRSVASPQRLLFRVGLTRGARLTPSKDGSGALEVVGKGRVLARITAPWARDAAGTAVPVSMSVAGSTVTLTIDHRSGSYLYPIYVDPEFNTTTDTTLNGHTWTFYSATGGYVLSEFGSEGLEITPSGGYAYGQRGELYYKTSGDSRIYDLTPSIEFPERVYGVGEDYLNGEGEIYLEYEGAGGRENRQTVAQSGVLITPHSQFCVSEPECSPTNGSEHNLVRLVELTTGTKWGTFLRSASVAISQPKETHSTVSYNTASAEVDGTTNVFHAGSWIGPNSGAFEVKAEDLGIGVAETKLEWYEGGYWLVYGEGGGTKKYLGTSSCAGIQCAPTQSEALNYANLLHEIELNNGEERIRFAAEDEIEHTWSSEHGEGEMVLKIDKTAPHGLSLTGLAGKGESLELGEVEAHLKAEATDGEGSVPDSGIKSLTLGIDGKEFGKPSGSCPSGTSCTAHGEWTINGAELGVGLHTLTLVATDNAGNVESKHYILTVYHASPVAIGPGSVNPESGDFALAATDVDMSGGAGSLAVTRHYDSRNLKEGEEGPLGPQWSISLGGLASLEVLPDNSVLVVGPEGITHFAVKSGGGFEPPPGDGNLKLELVGSEYLLKDATKGTTTKFTLPTGAKAWMPTVSEGPVSTGTMTDTYLSAEPEAGKTIIEPKLELAPHASASCPAGEPKKWERACRGLEFTYALATTSAKGEAESEWGEYKGRLMQVVLWAYNPATKVTEGKPVAEYAYDKLGRLRAEWDPRITPALRTTYGYDSEGHVVAMTPPGQETWAFTYGTIPGDPSTGRLLKSTQAPASAALWNGLATTATTTPTIGYSPVVGSRMNVNGRGNWTNGPVAYTFQWEQCNAEGKACIPIAGAINSIYVPVPGDVGHKLVVQVTAINGDGSATTTSSASGFIKGGEVSSSTPLTTGPWGIEDPRGVVVSSKGNIWDIGTKSDKLCEYNEKREYVRCVGSEGSGNGQFKEPSAVVIDPKGNLWVVDTGNNRVEEFNETGTYQKQFGTVGAGNGQLKTPEGIAVDASGNLWVSDTQNSRVQEFNSEGVYQLKFGAAGEAHGQFKAPTGINVDAKGDVWVADRGNSRVQEFNAKGEYVSVIGTKGTGNGQFEEPIAIASDSKGDLWVSELATSKIGAFGFRVQEFNEKGEYVGQIGTELGEGNGQFRSPMGVSVDPSGNIWVADSRVNRVQEFTATGGYEAQIGGKNEFHFEYPAAMTRDPKNNMWVVDEKYGLTQEFNEKGEFLKRFSTTGNGIAVDTKGNVWISQLASHQVLEFNEEGKTLRTVGSYGTGPGQFTGPRGVVVEPDGDIWVGDSSGRVEEFNETGEYLKELGGIGKEGGGAMAVDSKGHLWMVEEALYRVAEFTESGEYMKAANTGRYSSYIAVDASGQIWESGVEKVVVFSEEGVREFEFGTPAYWGESGSAGMALGAEGNVWIADPSNAQVTKWVPSIGGGAPLAAEPGSTIDYNVPLEGSEAPDQLGVNGETGKPEPEKWGQTDDPVYATAMFPPDEPQGWPAWDYKRATISYLDNQARTVDVAAPSGLVSTREFNGEGAVTRSLSAGGRAAALKESNPAEASKLLDTKNAYNGAGQLTDTWGPQHTVKLAKGKEGKSEEALVRNHVKYHYDEGSPGGATYNLVTKTEDGAETASKEEFDKRTSTTSYSGQSNLGWKLRKPTSTTTDPGGLNLTNTVKYEESTGNVIEATTPAGNGADATVAPAYSSAFGSKGSENGKFVEPRGVAMAKSANVYVLDTANSRVEEFSPAGVYIEKFGALGKEKGQLSTPYAIAVDAKGNVWIADTGNNRVDEFNEKREFVEAFGFGVSNGEEKLQVCTTSCKAGTAGAGTGQLKEPKGIAVTAAGAVYVTDTANNRVEEFSEKGEFLAAFGFGVSNGEAKFQVCTTGCKVGIAGSGNGQLSAPRGVAVTASSGIWVVDASNNRIEEFNEKHEYVAQVGSKGAGPAQFNEPTGIAIAASGTIAVSDGVNDRVEEFTSAGAFVTSFGLKGAGSGQFEEPWGVAIAASGNMYVADVKNSRVQTWAPAVTGNAGAHSGKTIYYTAKAEAEVGACREHPEWVGLPCQSTPTLQPGTTGLPELPVTTTTYNIWNQAEKVEEAFGSTIRTKKTTYDAAGRPLTTEETSTAGVALPAVKYEYSTETGALIKQSTTVGETTQAIKTKYNNLGQPVEYTDADGNTALFEYEAGKDARLIKVKDAKGNQTYHYNETTGLLTELVDSGAGTFKASYEVAGRLTSETYPDALTATYTRNQVGEVTGIEYVKTAHCAKTCPEVWFSETAVSSVHGEVLKQSSTLAEEPSYTYDAAGRLTQVQEIPAGEGCKTRMYSYDEEGNRTSETTREPGSEGKCATEGGSSEWHTYDTGNRSTDPGVVYEPFGNTTKLPAADAGGGSELTSEYYVDNQVAKQTQSEETTEYKLDPEDRTREAISKGKTAATVITHYDGPGGAASWTSEEAGKTWHRDIPGFDGGLTAVQTNEETPVLQLHDLQGNIVATVKDSELETKLFSKYNSTEFGVPSSKEVPPKYAWLGSSGVSSELPSGVVTQDGVTYVPQTGRPLQTEGLPLAALTNSATQFTRPIEAWVGSRAEEGAAIGLAKAKELEEELERINKPAGDATPAYPSWWCGGEYGPCEEEGEGGGGGGGGGGGCPGMNACAAGHHTTVQCSLQLVVGESNGWIYARGWGSCGGGDLPQFSELEVCAVAYTESRYVGGYGVCALAGSGYNPNNGKAEGPLVGTLYAHQHIQCVREGEYWAWGWFWVPGMSKGSQHYSHETSCNLGSTVLNYVWNFLSAGVDSAPGVPAD